MNKLITVILSFLICFLALELFFSNFYPQNLQGYFGYQLKNGLFVNKKNFQYIHRKANKSATYNF